jgi:hypothetical protein
MCADKVPILSVFATRVRHAILANLRRSESASVDTQPLLHHAQPRCVYPCTRRLQPHACQLPPRRSSRGPPQQLTIFPHKSGTWSAARGSLKKLHEPTTEIQDNGPSSRTRAGTWSVLVAYSRNATSQQGILKKIPHTHWANPKVAGEANGERGNNPVKLKLPITT